MDDCSDHGSYHAAPALADAPVARSGAPTVGVSRDAATGGDFTPLQLAGFATIRAKHARRTPKRD